MGSPTYTARMKAWRAKNADKLREQRRKPERKAKVREWAQIRNSRPEKWLTALVSNARYRAAKTAIEFTIRPEEIEIVTVCPVLNLKLQMGGRGTARFNSPSLDRIDPRKGYVPGNVRMISWRANKLKADATAEELEAVARYIRESISP